MRSIARLRSGLTPDVVAVDFRNGREEKTFVDLFKDLELSVFELVPMGLGGSLRVAPASAVAHYSADLLHIAPGPFVLIGYCDGGRLALSMAKELAALGAEVAALVLVNTNLDQSSPEDRLQAIYADVTGEQPSGGLDLSALLEALTLRWVAVTEESVSKRGVSKLPERLLAELRVRYEAYVHFAAACHMSSPTELVGVPTWLVLSRDAPVTNVPSWVRLVRLEAPHKHVLASLELRDLLSQLLDSLRRGRHF